MKVLVLLSVFLAGFNAVIGMHHPLHRNSMYPFMEQHPPYGIYPFLGYHHGHYLPHYCVFDCRIPFIPSVHHQPHEGHPEYHGIHFPNKLDHISLDYGSHLPHHIGHEHPTHHAEQHSHLGGRFPHNEGPFSHRLEHLPHHAEDFPHHVEDFPHHVEDFPHHVEDFPHHAEDFPQHAERFPHHANHFPHYDEPLSHRLDRSPHALVPPDHSGHEHQFQHHAEHTQAHHSQMQADVVVHHPTYYGHLTPFHLR